jgi:hypothetical protein
MLTTANPSVSHDEDGISIAKLAVKTNFNRWQRDFRVVACSKDYWNLYTGREQLLTKPDRHLYMMSKRTQDLDKAIKHTYTASTLIEEFRLDLDLYNEQAKRAREATLFLYKFLDPVRRSTLGRSFFGDPKTAFDAVAAQFEVSDIKSALGYAYGRIARVRLSDLGTMSKYCGELLLSSQDIKDLGGEYSDEQLKEQIVTGLNSEDSVYRRPGADERACLNSSSTTAEELFLLLLRNEADGRL